MKTITTELRTDDFEMAEDAVERRRKPIRLTTEQQELSAKYVPLARTLSKPFKQLWPKEIEEFDSASCLALVEAAYTFDPSRNVKFATFARFRILGALRDVQRRLVHRNHASELPNVPKVFRYVPGSEERDHLLLTTPDAHVDEVVAEIEEVEYWLGKLPDRQAVACREIYLNHRTQGETAGVIGCSKSRVSHLHQEALGRLRDSHEVLAAAIDRGFDIRRN